MLVGCCEEIECSRLLKQGKRREEEEEIVGEVGLGLGERRKKKEKKKREER